MGQHVTHYLHTQVLNDAMTMTVETVNSFITKSLRVLWSHRLAVRTPASHAGKLCGDFQIVLLDYANSSIGQDI